MVHVARPGAPTGRVDVRRRPAPRHVRLVDLAGIAGAASAVLVWRAGNLEWQVARAGIVIAIAGAVCAAASSAEDRWRGRITAPFGIVVLAVGAGFMPYLAERPRSPEAIAGVVAVAAGATLAVAGTLLATRGRGRSRRLAVGVGAVALALVVTFIVGPAVAATNVPPSAIGATPASRGLDYESVTLTTVDGVDLAGWYVGSTNRAALVLRHGAGSTRSSVLDEAAVLARHGFGVLLVDARGHGHSDGTAMDFGWYGDPDIAAATDYLAGRPDVDTDRIGVVGMSMGGEEAIGATATNELIRAVVAEGATARSAVDEAWLPDEFGVRGLVQEQLEHLQDRVTDVLTDASVPTSSRAAVAASGHTRYLLITAGDVADEGRSAAYVAEAAPDRVQVWTVPGAGHTQGLAARPEEWEARVVDFLTESLLIDAAA